MALTSGTLLGPYEIQSPLGVGGMGEVYRARDTRLDRTVAVKILPAHLSSNPEAQQRFDREARAISSLSHPNVCQLYDVGSHDGTSYLVMEYLEGETLADRLRKGPLPLEQVLKYAIEICEGLEKAHKSGVIHRDLKPGNIMLTKSGAKLLDFGLAKPALPASPPSSGLTQTIATPQHPLTTEGMVVGTFQYMSPEQVEGREADARSDIFALGAVLYEMVTGRRAFEGKTTASTIAAILAAEPPSISSLQPLSSPALEATVKSCLTKDPEERLQTVHDVKLQLKWIQDSGSSSRLAAVPVRRGSVDRIGWLVAAALLLVLVGAGAWWIHSRETPQAMFFNSATPFPAASVTLSPDGRTLALIAYSDQANKNVIWIHQIGSRSATILPGTEGAAYPFWSPDGRSLGFFAQGKLKTVDVASGRSPRVLADAPFGRGGTWNRDGIILFAANVWTGLSRVSASGGTPVQITTPDAAQFQVTHRWPVFLPDGRHYLYLACNFSGRLDKNMIMLGLLDSDEKHILVNASSIALYAEPGYLIYWRDNGLVAQHFDLRTNSLSGEPHVINDAVQYFPQTNYAAFAVSGNVLVAQTGAGKGAAPSQLTWFDRRGKPLGTVGPLALVANPKLSPDQRRVVVDQTDMDGRHVNVWTYDLSSDASTRLTFGLGLEEVPIWSPDAKQVLYSSDDTLFFSLYLTNADGSGTSEKVLDLKSQYQTAWDWSRDGKYVLTRKDGELWYMTTADRQPHPLVQKPWQVRNAQFSPDGKFVAYASDETGNSEIFVSPFPAFDSKWQVSRGAGGEEPRWRSDGRELFYLAPDRKLIAVDIKTSPSFQVGVPTPLFLTSPQPPVSALHFFSYDLTADGQKFLINTRSTTTSASPLSVTLNWPSELEK
jgi:eukaryotic-like serine/threonine-protein kinase